MTLRPKLIKVLQLIVWTIPLVIVPIAHGASSSPSPMGISLTYVDVIKILNGLVCWAMRLGVSLAALFWVIGGLQIMVGGRVGGDEKKLGILAGKATLTQVLIGFVVIFLASAILSVVADAVGAHYSPIPLIC